MDFEINYLYLDLLKRSITNYIYLGQSSQPSSFCWTNYYSQNYKWSIPDVCRPHTCLHIPQLDNLESCMLNVLADDIPGDFIEAGVYKGGAIIFMLGLLRSLEVHDRMVWAADSFEGIPVSSRAPHIDDVVDNWKDRWVAGLDEVKLNISRYDLLDDHVKFVQGYFVDTLPRIQTDKFAIVRLDGDSYESTMDALRALYPKISSRGYLIIDDWHLPGCRQAVFDYREEMNISELIFYKQTADGPQALDGVHEAYWRVA